MTQTPELAHPRLLNTRYGDVSAPLGTSDLITKFLEHYGEWAFLEAEYLASLLPPKARILDVGAFVGTFALGIAQTSDASFVAMVEGNPDIAPHLMANAARNLPCAYEVVNALVVNSSAAPTEAGWADADNAGSTSFAEFATGSVRVPAPSTSIGFKTLVERFGPLDLIKLDVEGMEEQLLADHPALLRDSSVLLWLECNESPRSLSLVQKLLDTGRPVSYFSWPSHNPENYRGASVKIFPFAHEAGLLLGADVTTLTPQQRRAGCTVRRLHTVEDLREALWLTPRWSPREWDDLERHEIAAIATHLWLGKKRESYLSESSATEESGSNQDPFLRLCAVKDAKISLLESALAKFAGASLANERLYELQNQKKFHEEQIKQHEENIRAVMEQLDQSRELQEQRDALHASQAAALADRIGALSSTLYNVQSSLTWRIALRLSRASSRVPLFKRAVRRLLRHKIAKAQQ